MPEDHAAQLTRAIDLLDELIAFDTVSARSNLPLVDRVEAYLRDLRLDPVRVPNAAGDKAALFVTVGPNVDGGVVLSGHTDTVPVTGQAWSSDPFTLRRAEGRLYGRGTCDMKGFDAVCLAMLPVFQKAPLRKPVHLLLSYDEEIGCLGSLDTIARFGADLPRPAIAIVGEPTEMAVVDAHKSIATYRTTVHGHEAHSSNPEAGANAIEGACALISELYRLQSELEAEGDPSGRFKPGYSTVHVGTIEGGNARNILARCCTFGWEFRGLPGVDQKRAIKRLDSFAARVVQPKLRRFAENAGIETEADVEVPGLALDPGSPAETLAKRLSRSNTTSTVAFATEAGQFQKAGLSTVVCGPGSIAQAHRPDEFIAIDELAACISFLHRLADELARP
jgi:acetylornithine deacetylase